MTLESKLLEKLADEAGSSRRHDFQTDHPESGWTVRITAERRDDLSCLVWEVSLRREAAGGDLTAVATEIAARTQALVEPFTVYEIDATRNEGLLRSKPVRKQGRASYYEVHLRGTGALTLRRFQAAEQGQRREQVAFALTNETLARLVGEIAGGTP